MTSDSQLGDEGAPELTALNAVVRALRALPQQLRRRVIDSAMLLLGEQAESSLMSAESPAGPPAHSAARPVTSSDIRTLKEQKNPKSANEMAALVAYYLSEVVPVAERRSTVDIADVTKYFKQALFHLPKNPKMILVSAKNAGYFDAAGDGKYRLNPVGYNLIVHSLPRTATNATKRRRSKSRPRTNRSATTRRKA
jgi:hypothetical protein